MSIVDIIKKYFCCCCYKKKRKVIKINFNPGELDVFISDKIELTDIDKCEYYYD